MLLNEFADLNNAVVNSVGDFKAIRLECLIDETMDELDAVEDYVVARVAAGNVWLRKNVDYVAVDLTDEVYETEYVDVEAGDEIEIHECDIADSTFESLVDSSCGV